MAKRRTAGGKSKTPPGRDAFIANLLENAQAQLKDITRRVDLGNRDSAEAERDARATAALAKVLCALTGDNGNDEAAAGDDEGPRDFDEFRRELGRQMDEIVSGRARRDPHTPDNAGD